LQLPTSCRPAADQLPTSCCPAAAQLPPAPDAHAMRESHFSLNLAGKRSHFLQANALIFCRQTLSFFAGKRSHFLQENAPVFWFILY
jgi:hypothetical protein